MSNTDQAPEPTMDEILASIRRIISDEPTENKSDQSGGDDSVADNIARALSFDSEPAVSGMDEDILELTEVVDRKPVQENNQFQDSHQEPAPPAFDSGGFSQNYPAEQSDQSSAMPEVSAFDDPSIFADSPADPQDGAGFQQERIDDIAGDLSAFSQDDKTEVVSDSFQPEQAPELGEALSWDSLQEGFGQNSQNEPVDQPEEKLVEDENVTFGQLSPEENLEDALEKAIEEIDPESSWDSREDEEPDVTEAEAQWGDDTQEELNASEENVHSEDTGNGEDMELSEASAPPEDKDELTEALAAVKQTVSQEVVEDTSEEDVQQQVSQEEEIAPASTVTDFEAPAVTEPEVSEVKPVQQAAPTAASVASPLEESIKDMLKPMLKEWLDDNMPRLLEGAMKEHKLVEKKEE